MGNKGKKGRSSGFTVIEILVAMVIFTIAYAAIANMLVQGVMGKKKGTARAIAIQLANNQLKMLNALPQPLYIGLPWDEVQDMLGNVSAVYERYKDSEGNYLPDEEWIEVDSEHNLYPLNAQTDADELKSMSEAAGVLFTRTLEKKVVSVAPCFVHIRIKISWIDENNDNEEQRNVKEEYEVESFCTRLNEFE